MKKVMFFQCGIWNPLVYILYTPKKKIMFFQCGMFKYFNFKGKHSIFSKWNLKPFRIYTLCSHEKKYVFSMWDLKPINIYTLYSQEKNHVFSMLDKKSFGLNTST
jgi:hypothetical protein